MALALRYDEAPHGTNAEGVAGAHDDR